MKKRIVSAVCAATFLVGSLGAPVVDSGVRLIPDLAVSADEPLVYGDTYTGYFYYKYLDDGTIEIVDYSTGGYGMHPEIPSSIEGTIVTRIGDSAFRDTWISSITIPSTITVIGDCAFTKCYNLTDVSLPNSVTNIGSAFMKCTGLESIKLSNKLTKLDERSFWQCENLKSITIPDSITSISFRAFFECYNLTKINIGSNNSVYSSVDGILYNKDKTTLLCCPGGKTSVTIPTTVSKLGDSSFECCVNLKEIIIPDNVKNLDSEVFLGCTGLKEIVIPNSITKISFGVFNDCKNLKKITIPKSVIDIRYSAFDNCSSLKDVYYNGTIKQWNNISIATENNTNEYLINATIHCTDGTINPKDEPVPERESITNAKVDVTNKTYTGKALNPAPKVTLGGKTLTKGTDYKVAYKNNKNCGKATVTVTGMGKYTGTKTASFIIKPKKVAVKKLTSPKTKTVKLTWAKAKGGVTGYKVQLALDKKFKKSPKTYTVKKAASAAKTVKGLKKGKTYYARVCAYKTVGKTTYKGSWSAVKKVKCK